MSTYYSPRANETGPPIPGIIGGSPAMEEVYRTTRRVARSNASVLLLGETGTGKELIANAIHRLSHRAGGTFVKVNCGALSESLLESELFGHVRGSFTGAISNRTGRFEAAHHGTIFLDEINSTSLHLQVKLLRVLQEREFERVGDTQTIRVDTRVIAASNRDLMEEVDAERFREDLYWRLNVVPIFIPPLRERREDVLPLVAHFLKVYSEVNDCYVVMAEGDELSVDLLPEVVRTGKAPRRSMSRVADLETLTYEVVQRGLDEADSKEQDLHGKIVNRVEKELIAQVMLSCAGVQTKAAARLGINRNTLHKKLKEYGLEK